jgi:hypothetical protein
MICYQKEGHELGVQCVKYTKHVIYLKYSYTWNAINIIYTLYIGTYTHTFYILKNIKGTSILLILGILF